MVWCVGVSYMLTGRVIGNGNGNDCGYVSVTSNGVVHWAHGASVNFVDCVMRGNDNWGFLRYF